LLQLALPLVQIVVQLNGLQLWMMVAHHVAKVVQHVLMVRPAPLVLLDTKAMDMEHAKNVMVEHILQLADLAFLALLANGQFLEVMFAEIVSQPLDALLALRLPLVKLVLLGTKAMTMEVVIHVMLGLTLKPMAKFVLVVPVANTLI